MLIELGLIQAETNIAIEYESHQVDAKYIYNSGKYVINATRKANSPKWNFPILGLTRVGKELLKLLTPIAVDDYIKEFYFYLEKQGNTVEYAFIIKKDDNKIEHTRPWMKFES